MNVPLIISVPHAGLLVPEEVSSICMLTEEQVREDSDEGAAEIYADLQELATVFVSSDVARAIVDLNRAPDDFRPDGVIKSHTSYNVPVYSYFPDQKLCNKLLDRYYWPYHARLTAAARSGAILGVDCHTMAAFGPPVGPDPGQERPLVCLSDNNHTCPQEWLTSLAACFAESLQTEISINSPFKGGHIVRRHAKEIPLMQLELSRTAAVSNQRKREGILQGLVTWCKARF